MSERPDDVATLERRDDFRHRLERLDVSLFKSIKSQTKRGDRASLLALQAACAESYGTFTYLEIGSHLGGSLQAFVRDPRCKDIVSIDLRPEATPDERGKLIPYQGNSTQRMLDLLGALPDADVAKIRTIDADTRSLDPAQIAAHPQLCFIDGEHTDSSCLADARFCRTLVGTDGAIAFHDAPIIFRAIRTFLRELRADGLEPVAYPLPNSVFVIELGSSRLYATAAMRRLVRGEENALPPDGRLLSVRPAGGPARELLLRHWWLSPAGTHRARVNVRKQLRRRRKRWRKDLRRVRRLAGRVAGRG